MAAPTQDEHFTSIIIISTAQACKRIIFMTVMLLSKLVKNAMYIKDLHLSFVFLCPHTDRL